MSIFSDLITSILSSIFAIRLLNKYRSTSNTASTSLLISNLPGRDINI